MAEILLARTVSSTGSCGTADKEKQVGAHTAVNSSDDDIDDDLCLSAEWFDTDTSRLNKSRGSGCSML